VTDISKTLSERGSRYGEFIDHAHYSQRIQRVFQQSPNWTKMRDDQREALTLIAHKIARIINGDPNYADSWHDLQGYALLVEQRLVKEQASVDD
jgi:hypothetical protein